VPILINSTGVGMSRAPIERFCANQFIARLEEAIQQAAINFFLTNTSCSYSVGE
jgi:hypothetical protein